ncbi:MAG: RNA polymerase sigma factor [Pirellulales bacterium]
MLDSVSESAHAELVERAVGGDRAALQELLVLHCEPLETYLARRLPRRVQGVLGAEDLLQQSLHDAAHGISRLEGRSRAAVRKWMQSIARHRLADALEAHDCRKRGGGWGRAEAIPVGHTSSVKDLVAVLADRAPSPSGDLARTEAVHAVQAGLAILPADQRLAVLSRYFEGKSLEQTAATMRRSPGAVRGLVDRAKHSLREALGRSSCWFGKK